MRLIFNKFILPILIITVCGNLHKCQNYKSGGNVQVQQMEYKGWEKAFKIDNGIIEAIVVPSIGRIMSFGYVAGKNLLWNNDSLLGKKLYYKDKNSAGSDWINYGGDKVWPLSEKYFPAVLDRSWPPDEYFDNSPFDFELLENGIILQSPVSQNTGTALRRKITMADSSSRLDIKQKLTQVKMNPSFPATIWSITQVIPPEIVIMDKNPDSKFNNSVIYMGEEGKPAVRNTEGHIWADAQVQGKYKFGTDSRQYLAAQFGKNLLIQNFEYYQDQKYPDGGCSVEVYFSPEYIEMELLSPERKMEQEESISFDISWELKELDNGEMDNIIETLKNID